MVSFSNVFHVWILPCFQEEMMVQEDPIKLKKLMAWSRRSKPRWCLLVHL